MTSARLVSLRIWVPGVRVDLDGQVGEACRAVALGQRVEQGEAAVDRILLTGREVDRQIPGRIAATWAGSARRRAPANMALAEVVSMPKPHIGSEM